jgi:protoporphyrin/coproporphyrin ferrochelatase
MTRRAVVLFNLGGPDRIDAVEPFLFNLFYDPAVIGLPAILRWPVARLGARRRAKTARGIYDKIGGGSPLRANTEAQAGALETRLGAGHRVFVSMRYWHPFADEAAQAVKEWGAEEILLLPLYPQFSSTTTASSLADWHRAARRAGIVAPTRAICCYPDEPGFIAGIAAEIRKILRLWQSKEAKRVLFSAHGLPERIVARGDPYPWQVERTVAAIRADLADDLAGIDSVLCYQSRVGPLKWIGPSIDEEIRRAGAAKTGLLVVPVAFVSEHSETLVELDIEFKHLAGRAGVPTYLRAPTVSVDDDFIAGLAALVERGFGQTVAVGSVGGGRLCPGSFRRCPCRGITA